MRRKTIHQRLSTSKRVSRSLARKLIDSEKRIENMKKGIEEVVKVLQETLAKLEDVPAREGVPDDVKKSDCVGIIKEVLLERGMCSESDFEEYEEFPPFGRVLTGGRDLKPRIP